MRGVPVQRLMLAAVVLVLALPGQTVADPGHEVTIAELTEQLKREPANADVYYQRAWNYRENGQPKEARADFEKSLALRAPWLPAVRELARLDFAEGHPEAAISRLTEALKAPPPGQEVSIPGSWAVLAEIYLARNQAAEALAAAEQGIAAADPIPQDLCLLRGEAQRMLGKLTERSRDLRAAADRISSVVLDYAAIDAAIDAGEGAEQMPRIEKELARVRFRSSWLIRRARVRLQSGSAEDKTAAETDLKEAVTEIEKRIRPELPEVSLLCDRGTARFLLGDRPGAEADLAEARKRGAAQWMYRTLSFLTEPRPAGGKP